MRYTIGNSVKEELKNVLAIQVAWDKDNTLVLDREYVIDGISINRLFLDSEDKIMGIDDMGDIINLEDLDDEIYKDLNSLVG